jgi:hypothetical protein
MMSSGKTKQSLERMEDSDDEENSPADRARLLDVESEPEQPDPIAARATIALYLEHIDDYMRSLEVSVSQFPFFC